MYSGNGIGVDNSPSSHTDNLKNDFLILGEGDTFGTNGSFGASEKKIKQNFACVCITIMIIVIYL